MVDYEETIGKVPRPNSVPATHGRHEKPSSGEAEKQNHAGNPQSEKIVKRSQDAETSINNIQSICLIGFFDDEALRRAAASSPARSRRFLQVPVPQPDPGAIAAATVSHAELVPKLEFGSRPNLRRWGTGRRRMLRKNLVLGNSGHRHSRNL